MNKNSSCPLPLVSCCTYDGVPERTAIVIVKCRQDHVVHLWLSIAAGIMVNG